MSEASRVEQDEPPLNWVERLAAAVPSLCILIAITAPVLATITDQSETKWGKVGAAPAYLFGFLLFHFASLMGYRFKVLWGGNYVIGVTLKYICLGVWLFFIGSCILRT